MLAVELADDLRAPGVAERRELFGKVDWMHRDRLDGGGEDGTALAETPATRYCCGCGRHQDTHGSGVECGCPGFPQIGCSKATF